MINGLSRFEDIRGDFQGEILNPQKWSHLAECNGMDSSDFFPDTEDGEITDSNGEIIAEHDRAIEACGNCAVRSACLNFALVTNVESGIWGGMSTPDRRRLRRRIRDRQKREKSSNVSQ